MRVSHEIFDIIQREREREEDDKNVRVLEGPRIPSSSVASRACAQPPKRAN